LVLAAKARALLTGRFNVSYDDIQAVAMPALRHRVQLNFEGQAAGLSVDQIISDVLGSVVRGR
jgi:MoxR-like ATPase